MPNMRKKSIQIIIALLISAIGLVIALRGVNLTEIGAALREVRWPWVVLGVGCMALSFWFRAYRWRMLLDGQLSVLEAFGLINIGYLISGILPLRAGDPARGVAAGMRTPVSVMAALSTVVIERTLDLLTVAIFLVLTLPFITVGDSVVAGLASGGAALTLLVVLVLMARFPEATESFARAILERLPLGDPERWLAPLRDILAGLRVLRSPRKGLGLLGFSAAIWGAVVVYYIVLQQALLFEAMPPAPLLTALTVTWATALGMAVPSQGGIGGYHAAARWALSLFGVGSALAATYGLLAHAISYLLGMILGAIALMVWGISIRDLSTKSQAVAEKETTNPCEG